MKKYWFMFLLFMHNQGYAHSADIIIFSYNRPLQLYALLESIDTYMTDISHVQVLFRASSKKYHAAYHIVQKDFPHVSFYAQGINPDNDFKPLVIQMLKQIKSHYLLFAVDDNIVKDYVSLAECIEALEKTNACGFFLRFGKNTYGPYGSVSYDYLPAFTPINDRILQWEFSSSIHYWNYPYTVDMTIYRTTDVIAHLISGLFRTPNQLEGYWISKPPTNPYGICFTTSKIVNIPLNRIQTDFPTNPSMDFASPEELLQIFNEGKKIDISSLHQVHNTAPYMHIDPSFIQRNERKQ